MSKQKMNPLDILILSNGPGEITTWVLPVVKQMRAQLGHDPEQVRVSLVLSPCPHATGNEVAIASQYPEIDRVQGAAHFFPFLLWGKTVAPWDWRQEGLVLFLGGDQFYAVFIAKRLGYQSLVYAEWEARWYRFADRFAVMKQEVIDKLPPQFQPKCTVVGDLMADVEQLGAGSPGEGDCPELIGLLPGSKPSKLTQGVPFTLAIAEYVHRRRPQTKFIIPVAPTLDIHALARYANPRHNPLVATFGGISAELLVLDSVAAAAKKRAFLRTAQGLRVELIAEFPCYQLLKKCQICLTTIGANTAQLGSLGVPMIVLIPSYQWDAMKSWDGLPGLLVNLPLLGTSLAKFINWLAVAYTIKTKKKYAWPNLWARREIVPELIGYLKVEDIGDLVLDYLADPLKLVKIRQDLREVRGTSGAAAKIVNLISSMVSREN